MKRRPRADADPFLAAWLRRTRRELAVSGTASQLAQVLATRCGGAAAAWETRLRRILDGEEIPDAELLVTLDSVLGARGSGRTQARGSGLDAQQNSWW